MARGLTKKQKGFVRDYVKTGNGTQAALKNYDTRDYDTAGVIAVENLGKPKVIEALKSYADRIPNELLERVHLEGLEASNKIVKDGEVVVEIPDYAVRHKYLDSAYKLKGSYAPEKSTSLNVNLDRKIEDKDAEALRLEFEEKLKARYEVI